MLNTLPTGNDVASKQDVTTSYLGAVVEAPAPPKVDIVPVQRGALQIVKNVVLKFVSIPIVTVIEGLLQPTS